MRTLLWMPGLDVIPGGHRVQFDQTCRRLNDLGVSARVTFEQSPALEGVDVVHGFGLTPMQVRECRLKGLPVVLSTIYWSRAYTTGLHDTAPKHVVLTHRLRAGLTLLRSALVGQHNEKCEAMVERQLSTRVSYEMADLLLPNSQSEADTIISDLHVTTPYAIVPNAVDQRLFQWSENESAPRKNSVLYVGRFEPHKNQLGFIEVMRDTDVPVSLVGHPHPHHPAYYERCLQRATKNILILPGVPHEQLPAIYASAKVHVLPSWFETTGLVSLEAALCGCNIVTTSRGYARDYFGDMAWYCDPADSRSIRKAVTAALEGPSVTGLRNHIMNNFTWEHTGRATLLAYERVSRGNRV